MRARTVALLGGMTLVGVVIAKLVADTGAPAPEPSEVAVAERAVDPVGLEVQRLRADVRALRAAPGTPATKPAPEPQLSREDRIARSKERLARIEDDLGARLRAETVDGTWARETEATIASTITTSGLQLESISCGSTMCRVGVTAPEQVAELDLVLENMTMTEPFRHGGFLRHTGPRTITMFVARKGHPLSRPPRS
jgi:hypothetical protein